MIGQFIALYQARKDSALAKRIAGEMLVDGAIDRATWPLTLAKLWMAVGITILTIIILAFLVIATLTHWTLAIPTLPLGGAIYGIIRIWRGMNEGVERVTVFMKSELNTRSENLKAPRFRKSKSEDDEVQL